MPEEQVTACPVCENEYLALRTDVYKDARPFVYCDCCGAMADKRTWLLAQIGRQVQDQKE